MKRDLQRMILAGVIPLLLILTLYLIRFLEVGLDLDFTRGGVYPLHKQGLLGILTHPFIHHGFKHLLSNTIPLFFLSWCLYYFYREIASIILCCLWITCGLLTFFIGTPGWHVGASGVIYGLTFFLFFSGLLRKHIPLIAISFLVTFLYGGIVWNMFPQFAQAGTSWEGHLSGCITGILCSVVFVKYGPQRPIPFEEEEEDLDDNEVKEDIEEDTEPNKETDIDSAETKETEGESVNKEEKIEIERTEENRGNKCDVTKKTPENNHS